MTKRDKNDAKIESARMRSTEQAWWQSGREAAMATVAGRVIRANAMTGEEPRARGSDLRTASVAATTVCLLGLGVGITAGWLGGLTDPDHGLARFDAAAVDREGGIAQTSRDVWDRFASLGQIEFRFRSEEELRQTAQRNAETQQRARERRSREATRSSEALLARFEAHDFDLESIGAGLAEVPRVYVAALPNDFAYGSVSDQRKSMFIKSLLPLILKHNEQIAADRERLRKLSDRRDHGHDLRGSDIEWLIALADRYNVDGLNLDELLRRVDVVPPSLALAQAVEESGWGTSRFAHRGNAIFGQYTEQPGSGIVPLNRPDGSKIEIMRFDHLEASVGSYIMNLNRHNAYRDFRDRRAQMRNQGVEPDGAALAQGLTRYSSRGSDYIRTIRSIIRANGFERFDRAKLRAAVTAQNEDETREQL